MSLPHNNNVSRGATVNDIERKTIKIIAYPDPFWQIAWLFFPNDRKNRLILMLSQSIYFLTKQLLKLYDK